MSSSTKAKVSISVPRVLLSHVDGAVRRGRFVSRSAVVETAVARWWQDERRRARDAEIDAYYGALAPSERDEDRRWATASGAAFGTAFAKSDAEDARAPRSRRARKRAPA